MGGPMRYSPWPAGQEDIVQAAGAFKTPVEAFHPEGMAFVRGQAEGAGCGTFGAWRRRQPVIPSKPR